MAEALQVFIVRDLTEVRTFSSFPRDKTDLLLEAEGRRYRFDPESIVQDVGDVRVIRPFDVPAGSPGRWTSRERRRTVRNIVSSETLTDDDHTIRASAHGASISPRLPSARGRRGQVYVILKTDGTLNTVTVLPKTGEKINDLDAVRMHDKHELLEVVSDDARWRIRNRIYAPLVFQSPKGLVPSNAADADHDITISAGADISSAGTQVLRLSAAITKQIDAVFAPGNDAGGRFLGVALTADTWYHFFLIRRDADGLIDSGFDTSISAANIPAGFTAFKRVSDHLTDGGSNIISTTAEEIAGGGLEVLWKDPPLDAANSHSSTAATITLSVPTGHKPLALMNLEIDASNPRQVYISSLDVNDEVPSMTAAPLATIAVQDQDGDSDSIAAQGQVRVNTSAQVRWRSNASGAGNRRIVTFGWLDARRD